MGHGDRQRGIGRVALLAGVAAALVAAVVAFVVVTGDGDDGGFVQLFLEPAAAAGPDPFTDSVDATRPVQPTPIPAPGVNAAERDLQTEEVAATTPGLYGGSGRSDECDVESLISFLTEHEAQGRAWAGVQGIDFDELPEYVRSLTPVLLTRDVRVTNHGFRDGEATPRQSVLQAGTAVLVDAEGVPRTRCACGNPLLEPEPLSQTRFVGEPWPSFDPVHVTPAPAPVDTLSLDCVSGDLPAADGETPEGPTDLYVGRYDTPLDRSPLQNIRNVVRVTVFTSTGQIGFASNQDYAPADALGEEALRIHVHGDGFGSVAGSSVSWEGRSEPNTAPFDDAPDSSDPASVQATIDDGAGQVTGTVVHADGTTQDFTATKVSSTSPGAGGEAAPGTAGLAVVCLEAGTGPDGDDLDDALVAAGEFTSFPGDLPGELLTNRVDLVIRHGAVTGDSEWSSTHPAGTVTHTATWTGTFDADSGTASGSVQVTVTLPDGSTTAGTGTWSAEVDEVTGSLSGSVTVDGQTLEFAASLAG